MGWDHYGVDQSSSKSTSKGPKMGCWKTTTNLRLARGWLNILATVAEYSATVQPRQPRWPKYRFNDYDVDQSSSKSTDRSVILAGYIVLELVSRAQLELAECLICGTPPIHLRHIPLRHVTRQHAPKLHRCHQCCDSNGKIKAVEEVLPLQRNKGMWCVLQCVCDVFAMHLMRVAVQAHADFYRNKSTQDGLQKSCKQCDKTMQQQHQARWKEVDKEGWRRYNRIAKQSQRAKKQNKGKWWPTHK